MQKQAQERIEENMSSQRRLTDLEDVEEQLTIVNQIMDDNGMTQVVFDNDKSGNRLTEMMKVILAHIGRQESEPYIRKLQKTMIPVTRQKQLEDAGIIVKFRYGKRGKPSGFITRRDFTAYILEYIPGWKNAPRNHTIPLPSQASNIADPRTNFDFQLASSFANLMIFVLAVIRFINLVGRDGKYMVKKLIFGCGVYRGLHEAKICLNNLIKNNRLCLDIFTIIDDEYYVGVTEFVLYVLSKINGPIPKAVAQADAQNGLLTRLGSTQVLETTMRNAQDIIDGTPEQRRLAQQALMQVERQNQDTTREDIKNNRTFIPSGSGQQSSVANPDPELIKLQLLKEIEDKKVETALINKKKSIKTAKYQRLKNLDLQKEREIILSDKRKRDEESFELLKAQREDAAKAVNRKYRAQITANKARKAEADALAAEKNIAIAQQNAVASEKNAEIEREKTKQEVAKYKYLSLQIQDEAAKRATLQATCQYAISGSKPIFQNMKHVVAVAFSTLLEPSIHWDEQVCGSNLMMNILFFQIRMWRSQAATFIPSLDFYENEVNFDYIITLIKDECNKRSINFLIREQAPKVAQHNEEGDLIKQSEISNCDRPVLNFSIPNYKFKSTKQLYPLGREISIEAYCKISKCKVEQVHIGLSSTQKKYHIIDRSPPDMAWHEMLQKFHQEYKKNPPGRRPGPRRIQFRKEEILETEE